MERQHWPEFEDFPWFPDALRRAMTGYLQAIYRVARLDRVLVPYLSKAMDKAGTSSIIDLGSGAGGAIPLILAKGFAERPEVRARMTDLYPNKEAIQRYGTDAKARLSYEPDSVDATNVPEQLHGVRTMIASFHHLREPLAKGVLADAAASKQPIAIFEPFERSPAALVSLFLAPVMTWLLMPLVRPFRWYFPIVTYLIPLVPFLVLWDGVASMMRIYSDKELKALTADLRRDDYEWEIGRLHITGSPNYAPYLIGYPV